MANQNRRARILALIAAALFGASAPLAKVLLADIEPVTLASFLYLGSGIGAAGIIATRRLRARSDNMAGEARLAVRDLPWLLGAVAAGGVAAPIVLLLGLRVTPAATASLLLSFEIVATTLVASVPLMLGGALLLLREAHSHGHDHAELFHEHRHSHDDGHHDHDHETGEIPAPGGRHSHPHRHAPVTHAHEHTPDLHHEHGHP